MTHCDLCLHYCQINNTYKLLALFPFSCSTHTLLFDHTVWLFQQGNKLYWGKDCRHRDRRLPKKSRTWNPTSGSKVQDDIGFSNWSISWLQWFHSTYFHQISVLSTSKEGVQTKKMVRNGCIGIIHTFWQWKRKNNHSKLNWTDWSDYRIFTTIGRTGL